MTFTFNPLITDTIALTSSPYYITLYLRNFASGALTKYNFAVSLIPDSAPKFTDSSLQNQPSIYVNTTSFYSLPLATDA